MLLIVSHVKLQSVDHLNQHLLEIVLPPMESVELERKLSKLALAGLIKPKSVSILLKPVKSNVQLFMAPVLAHRLILTIFPPKSATSQMIQIAKLVIQLFVALLELLLSARAQQLAMGVKRSPELVSTGLTAPKPVLIKLIYVTNKLVKEFALARVLTKII